MAVPAEVGAKGRLVIPAQVRTEAGIASGQTLIASADGIGRIVLETPEVVQARVWATAPPSDPDADSVRDVRALRAEDNRVAEAAHRRRNPPVVAHPADEEDEAGQALLAALGL